MESSIRRRFAFTVGANLFRAGLGFATSMLLARWLSPKPYGNLAFLMGTFMGFRQLLDMGSSSAFFTFLSQKRRSRRFVQAFFAWLGLQFMIPLLVIGLLFPAAWLEHIWHGQPRSLVLLAFAATFMQNSVWPVVQQAGESQRQTIWVQGLSVVVVGAHLAAVVLLWWVGRLGLYAVLAAITLEYLLAAIFGQRGLAFAPPDEEKERIFEKYLNYCLPLVAYSCVGFAYDFADRWLLQTFGGSVQQAYYSVGSQFAAVALLGTTSVLRIFWKEVAEAHGQGNHVRTGELYRKVSRSLFLVGAIIAGFLVPWSEQLLRLILGTAYVGGAATLAIMFVYPVHQSMGQIGGTMLMATEKISLQVTIGMVCMVASMGASYFVLAPPQAAVPGLGLASEGLAIKMCVMQVLQVNAIAFAIAKLWKWPFDWVYQFVGLGGCLIAGWIAHGFAAGVAAKTWPLPFLMVLGGGCYLGLIAGLVYALPWLTGLSRSELAADLRRLYRGAGWVFN